MGWRDDRAFRVEMGRRPGDRRIMEFHRVIVPSKTCRKDSQQ